MAQPVDSIAPRGGGRQLLLVGVGHAHLRLLARLAAQPLAGVQVTLVAPVARQFCPAMVPGFVAGDYSLADCAVEFAPLLRNAAVRPVEAFGALWPRVTGLAPERLRSLAVIGAGVTGIELATAVRHRLPQAAVTLVSGSGPVGAAHPAGQRKRIAKALQQRAITVLPDVARALQPREIVLGCGARLACDVPLIAIGRQAPGWLTGSGLALDPTRYVAVGACQRSTSHPTVFASGDANNRADHGAARNAVRALAAPAGYSCFDTTLT